MTHRTVNDRQPFVNAASTARQRLFEERKRQSQIDPWHRAVDSFSAGVSQRRMSGLNSLQAHEVPDLELLSAPEPIRTEVVVPEPARRLTQVLKKTRIKVRIFERKERAKGVLWYTGAALLSMAVLAFTGYIGIDTWVTNSEVKQAVAEKKQAAEGAVSVGEGEDETEVKPSAVDAYKVAADLPRILTIDRIAVRARILPMSVNNDGAVQAPINIYDSGWYTGSAKPGQKGAAFIDAHASGMTREGLFAYLDKLKKDDTLSVELGSGEVLKYKVVHTEAQKLDAIDMAKVLRPYADVREGLNLMTCTGSWVKDKNTYDSRVIVYTERIA